MRKTTLIVAALTVATVLLVIISGPAGTRKVSVSTRDITITLDGRELELRDVNGRKHEPLLIDGVTYIPISALSETFQFDLKWDGANGVVRLISQDKSDGNRLPDRESGRYLASAESDKYHEPDCRVAENIAARNRVWFKNAREAEQFEYVPCGVCLP